MKLAGIVCLGILIVAGLVKATDAGLPKQPVIATFSIAAVDPEAGTCGAAVASRFPAVGGVVAHARAGVGAFCTQFLDLRGWGPKALDLLEQEKLPEEILAEILRTDKYPGMRQLAIIDMQGRSAQHHPVSAGPAANYWGGMSGRFYVCQGNTLTGRDVIVAMAKAYEETRGSLADRLMAAVVAGDCAGGDYRGRLATGIRVCKKGVEGYWLDLQVDKSDDAVVELHRRYVESNHEARGEWGKRSYEHPCLNRPAPKRPQ